MLPRRALPAAHFDRNAAYTSHGLGALHAAYRLLASTPPEQREQNPRQNPNNGLRFFAGFAAKKWPPFLTGVRI